jgi:hypothetical protein
VAKSIVNDVEFNGADASNHKRDLVASTVFGFNFFDSVLDVRHNVQMEQDLAIVSSTKLDFFAVIAELLNKGAHTTNIFGSKTASRAVNVKRVPGSRYDRTRVWVQVNKLNTENAVLRHAFVIDKADNR